MATHGLRSFLPKLTQHVWSLLPLGIFLAIYLVFSLYTHTDFGVTWDENDFYSGGRDLYAHLLIPGAPSAPRLTEKSTGVQILSAYDYMYSAALYNFNKDQSYEDYHLMNMLFASLMYIAAYCMLLAHYKKARYAILGPIFLLLTPRLFGHVPANPKDMPFAVMYLVGIASIFLLPRDKYPYLRVALIGGIFGVTQSFRIIGFSIYGLLILYDVYDFLKKEPITKKKIVDFVFNEVLFVGLVGTVAMFIMTITWPYIGSNFFKNFLDILDSSKSYPWIGEVLFAGQRVLSNDLPLRYLPTWILITTPLFILFFGTYALVRGFRTNFKHPLIFISVIALFLNLSMYFLLKPVLYDGLRHFLFVLPIIAFLGSIGFIELLKNFSAVRYIGIVIFVVGSVGVLVSYGHLHPYQYVYFNSLTGGLNGAYEKYETDYWGASFRESVMWLKEHKRDGHVAIYTCAHPFISAYYFDESMHWSDNPAESDYNICYTRDINHAKLPGDIIYTVDRFNVPLSIVKENKAISQQGE